MTEFEAYLRIGFDHIIDPKGYDHILFVIALCTIYQLRDWRKVLVLVTAFTVGHSVTLALSVFNVVIIRSDIIEALIPITILITSLSNFFYRTPDTLATEKQKPGFRYLSALLFGFIHGLGFSNYLKSLLGTSSNIASQLLAFNLGLEIGQFFIVLIALALGHVTTRHFKVNRRDWNLIVSGIVAGMALSLIMQAELFQ